MMNTIKLLHSSLLRMIQFQNKFSVHNDQTSSVSITIRWHTYSSGPPQDRRYGSWVNRGINCFHGWGWRIVDQIIWTWWIVRSSSRWTKTNMVNMPADRSTITKCHMAWPGTLYGGDWSGYPSFPAREVSDKHWVSHLESSLLGMNIMLFFLRLLFVLHSVRDSWFEEV